MSWPKVALGDVADFVRGITFKPDDVIPVGTKDAVACLRTKNVQEDVDIADVWGIPARFVRRPEQYLQNGDILVSTANSWNLVGKCSWVSNLPWPATIGGFISALRASDRVDPRYLYHWFASGRVQAEVRKCARKTTNISNLSFEQCLALQIPLPSLPEQRRIAGILDQAEALRRLRRQSLSRISDLGQAIFYEMFGDLRTNSKNWNTAKLGDLCDLVRGSSPRPQGDPRYFGGPVPRLMIADITRDGKRVSPRIDSLTVDGAKRSRPMEAGSVVMAVSGAVGLPAILAENACIHDGFVGFRNLDNSLVPDFLYHYLVVQRIENSSKGTGAIWKNLTTDHVREFIVPCPTILEQRKFLDAIETIDAKELQLMSHANRIDSLFASLQHRAFRGEL